MAPIIVAIVVALVVLALGVRTVRIVPQARVSIIQRLGNDHRTADPRPRRGQGLTARSGTPIARSGLMTRAVATLYRGC